MPIPRRLNILYNNKQKRYYKNVKYPAIPLNPQDIYIVASANQRLDLLAKRFYNDVDLWWVINIANPNLVPRDRNEKREGLHNALSDCIFHAKKVQKIYL